MEENPPPVPHLSTAEEERPGKALGITFERSLYPMLVVDEDRRYLDANTAACLFMRMPREEVVGRRVDDFVPPETLEGFEDAWEDFLATGISPDASTWYFAEEDRRVPIMVGTSQIGDGMHLIVVMPWRSNNEAESAMAGQGGARKAAGARLSSREREVLTMLAMGSSGDEIAETLFISPETVRTHVQHIRLKLGASTRGHAIAIALMNGEISTEGIE